MAPEKYYLLMDNSSREKMKRSTAINLPLRRLGYVCTYYVDELKVLALGFNQS